MKLYCQPGACSTAGHIVLEWAGGPYEVEKISREFKQTPEFRALNPAGAVPVLVDGDFVLTQNVALYGYIVDSNPGCGLLGDGSPRQRAEATRWIGYVNSDLHPAFKPLFATARFGGEGDCEAPVREAAMANIPAVLEHAERRLADRDWLAGFRSPADAYLYITLRWASALGIELEPNLTAFVERIESDGQVRKVLAEEELDPVAD